MEFTIVPPEGGQCDPALQLPTIVISAPVTLSNKHVTNAVWYVTQLYV